MKLEVKFSGTSLASYGEKVGQLGHTAMAVGAAELNTRGGIMRQGLAGVLTDQTGLKRSVLNRALRERKASAGTPVYEILATGGNISLSHFKAKETPEGVSAAPWNQRQTYGGTFMKAGWWPNRVAKPNWNGQVFRRAGGKTSTGKAKFIKVKSGLFIGEEMVKGESLAFFEQASEQIGLAVVRAVEARLP